MRLSTAGWSASILMLLGLWAAPALADNCDSPPQPQDFTDDRTKKWTFCITVSKNDAGDWHLEDDRKTVPIEVPVDDTADLIFIMDRDYHPGAWLAAISIKRAVGDTPPADEFVGETNLQFADGNRKNLPGKRPRYKISNKNSVAAEYDYEIWIATDEQGDPFPVDPRIKNGGRSN